MEGIVFQESLSLLEEVRAFLNTGYGYGYGSGSGSGDGDGDGSGDGDGYGYGSGYGDGYGDGSGDGYGYGDGYGDGDVKQPIPVIGGVIASIDSTFTIITSVHGNYAKGKFSNLDGKPGNDCYIAKVHGYFAHGVTLRNAVRDANAKWFNDQPLVEKIASFQKEFPEPDTKYSGKDLFDWHHNMTGSCEAGRRRWCEEHGLDPDKDNLTVREFCKLTRNDYGGDVIKALADAYGIAL